MYKPVEAKQGLMCQKAGAAKTRFACCPKHGSSVGLIFNFSWGAVQDITADSFCSKPPRTSSKLNCPALAIRLSRTLKIFQNFCQQQKGMVCILAINPSLPIMPMILVSSVDVALHISRPSLPPAWSCRYFSRMGLFGAALSLSLFFYFYIPVVLIM